MGHKGIKTAHEDINDVADTKKETDPHMKRQ